MGSSSHGTLQISARCPDSAYESSRNLVDQSSHNLLAAAQCCSESDPEVQQECREFDAALVALHEKTCEQVEQLLERTTVHYCSEEGTTHSDEHFTF